MNLSTFLTVLVLGSASVAPSAFAHSTDVHDYYPKPKAYPLAKCLVTDDKLGEHGKPHVFTYKQQQIKLCCKSCRKEFKKDPPKYLRKLSAAK